MNRIKQIPSQCKSCGGQIEQLDKNTYRCVHCDSLYYISTSTVRKVGVHISIKTFVIRMAIAIIALIAIALIAYQAYTVSLVEDASRFSIAFRDFLLDVYDKPVANIDDEDLARIKYLRIERIKKCYHFTYSFEDYYDYIPTEFENHTETVMIKESIQDFSPSNIQYLSGLTRLELYTNSWHNYVLPEGNQLRSIICISRADISRCGSSPFFEKVNPNTLEEISIYSEENLDEDRYILQDIQAVKHLTLERLVCDDPAIFKDFNQLTELYLLYPVIEEADAYEIIESILQCPELERFVIEGKAAWYLSEDEWNTLQKTYDKKIELVRK